MAEREMDLISVIVPVYGVEAYLERCVGSILAQTYGDIEVILVDDGSPDRCGEICDGYAARDSRVRVVHKKNGGLSSARNAGIDIARGDFIGFVDGDDRIEPEMYERLHAAIVEYRADISVCSRYIEYEDGTRRGYATLHRPLVMDREEALARIVSFSDFDMAAWDKLYRRGLFDAVRYPEGKIHEDYYVTPDLFDRCGRIVYIPENLYCYLQRDNSITRRKYEFVPTDIVKASEFLVEWYGEHHPDLSYVAGTALAFSYISVLNKHILNDVPVDPAFMAEAREAVSQNLSAVVKNKVIPLKKKAQPALLLFNFALYRRFLLKQKGKPA